MTDDPTFGGGAIYPRYSYWAIGLTPALSDKAVPSGRTALGFRRYVLTGLFSGRPRSKLGTCAYLLSSFENQMRTRTFTMSVANSARFLIAGIPARAVVGVFNRLQRHAGRFRPASGRGIPGRLCRECLFRVPDSLLLLFTRSRSVPTAPAPSASGTGYSRDLTHSRCSH